MFNNDIQTKLNAMFLLFFLLGVEGLIMNIAKNKTYVQGTLDMLTIPKY